MKICTIFSRVIITGFISVIIAASALSQTILDNLDRLEYVPDRLIVKLKEGIPQAEVTSMLQSVNARSVQRFQRIGAEVWELSGISVGDAIRLYHNDPRIEYIEPDLIHQLVKPVEIQNDGIRRYNDGIIPDDYFFHLQWALRNTGQAPFYGTEGADIDATRAWTLTTGGDVLIAILDTGIDYYHEDIAGNMWEGIGYDFAYNDNDPSDYNGHGTHVAGIVAATGNNGMGVTGVNWSAKLMAVKVLGDEGWGYTSSIIAGIEYTIDHGVKVSNHSYGSPEYQQAMFDAFEAARDAGQLVITAAGNWAENSDVYPFYPANFDLDNIIAVASTDYNDFLSPFSNYGQNSVHLAAPGHMIGSTYLDNMYVYMWGTSMAAPHVAGTAGLIYSLKPELDYSTIKEHILVSTDPLPSLVGRTMTGGRLNAYYAVAGPNDIPPAKIEDLEVISIVSNSVTLQWTAVGESEHAGTASFYDIRYSSLGMIDGNNFNEAAPVGNPPLPQPSGSVETFTIDGLEFNTTYHFAIRVRDRWGNESEVSNSPSFTLAGPPIIGISPLSLSESLFSGETSTQVLTITNSGESGMFFSIVTEPDFDTQSMRFVERSTESKNSSKSLRASDRIDRVQNSYDLSIQSNIPNSGYIQRVTTSNTSSNFASVLLIQDVSPWGSYANQTILQDHGIDYHMIISSDIGKTNLSNYKLIVIPSDQTDHFYAVLASFQDKLNTFVSNGGVLEFHAAGWGWNWGDASQVMLPGDVTINVNYSEYNFVIDPSHPIVEGIPSTLWGEYASHAYFENIPQSARRIVEDINGYVNLIEYRVGNGTVIASGQTLEIGYEWGWDVGLVLENMIPYAFNLAHVSWLSVNPYRGIIPASSEIKIEVLFDAKGLFGGDYNANIVILNNDPENSSVNVPVHLHVTGVPEIDVSPSVLDFKTVFTGSEKILEVIITNQGTEVLEVYSTEITNGVFHAESDGFTLQPFTNHLLSVTFAPGNIGNYTGMLTILSSDPDEEEITVELLGSAVNPPVITVTPSSIADHLLSGETSEHTLTIKNTGESDLEFMISAEHVVNTKASVSLPKPLSILHDYERNTNYTRVQKGAQDLRKGIPVIQNTGGPDEYGYSWIDSNEPGGPVFDWFDISQVGTRLTLYDDDFAEVELPFLFPFYGENKAAAYISSNGFITFIEDYAYWIPYEPIPYPYPPNDFIMPFGTDLNPEVRGSVYYYNDLPNERVIVQYHDVPRYFAHGSYTFQAFLYKNGSIVFQYLLMDGNIDIATIGIENAEGTDGLQVAFNTPYVENNLAVRIATIPKWLALSPVSGTVPSGEEQTVTVQLNATGLFGGEYNANITVHSNDPVTPEVHIPVNLSVTGIPMINVSDTSLDFGNIFAGGTSIQHLVVTNPGTDELVVDDVSSDREQFMVDSATFTLSPGAAKIVPVTFRPDSVRAYSGALTISSNAHIEDNYVIWLSGVGLPPPVLAVSIDTLEVAIAGGMKSNELLQLFNHGLNDLTVDLFTQRNNGIPLLPSRQLRVAILYENCMYIDEIPIQLAVYPDFETIDMINVTATVPSLSILRNYHTVLVANQCPVNAPVTLGNRLSEYVESGGSVVVTVAGFAKPYHIQGKFLNDEYIPFEVEDNYFGYGWLSAYDPLHPIMAGVNQAESYYSVHNLKTAEGADQIATLNTWNGETAFVATQNAVVGVNVSIANWNWWGDVPRLLRNAIVYAHKMSGPTWLSVSPDRGIIPPNNSLYINVLFDATGLDEAVYYADLVLYSNDPLRSTVIIPGKFKMAVPVETAVNNLPDKFALHQNFPNPFNPATTIKYDIPAASKVIIQVYSILGEKVATLVNEEQQPGYYSLEWNGRTDSGQSVASGVYIYTIAAGDFRQANKMVFLK